ncbi:MAG TPA: DUF3267 domain-containing protein [Thermoflexales bacterium]|mgnify:CR=1 FL=1|nr:DUF3267 domain-containing protein [Anaerolineae bacterium]HQV29151.1 DUF3267 domain-containing protein [Thermoflexales bacterium]HQX11106.1 DUF3267 domain-containing protein [Thermoflexales bacterium]HQY26589.1 DUF3267 domain-containing protein [Thermoflexales bacterium]HQZ54367.1 DUF3267 domain-containing protein [Thermoflexales bacterium]
MQDTTKQSHPSGALPDGYHEVLYWRVTDKPVRVIVLQAVGVLLLLVFGVIFFSIAGSLGRMPTQGNIGPLEIGLMLVAILLTFVLHEATHGLVMRALGARPQYGILWKSAMLYATSPGFSYRRNSYIVISLAPLVVLSALVVLGMWLMQGTLWVAVLAVCGAFNAAGAIGDVWISTIVLRYAPTARIVDERDGIRVYLPGPAA